MGRRERRGDRLPSGFRSLRDVLTAGLGAAGIVHETVLAETERPTLLIVFAGLLGLPLVFRETDKGAKPPAVEGDKSVTQGGDSTDGPG